MNNSEGCVCGLLLYDPYCALFVCWCERVMCSEEVGIFMKLLVYGIGLVWCFVEIEGSSYVLCNGDIVLFVNMLEVFCCGDI